MPFEYTPEQRLDAFRLLIETMGDVNHVASKTGISQRTLHYWKSQYRIRVTAEPADMPDKSDQFFKEQYRFIRAKLFRQVSNCIEQMERYMSPDVLADLTPSLARLIDRLERMENLIRDTHFTFQIAWLNQDELLNYDPPHNEQS